jgi:hypothetical protein
MTLSVVPIASTLPHKFWKVRDAAIEHLLSKAPLPAALVDLQEWLATDGWNDLLAAWINEDVALKSGRFLERFSDSYLSDSECLDASDVITDSMRIDFGRSTIRTLILEGDGYFNPSVHSFAIERDDGQRAVLGCTVEIHGQFGPVPQWHGVFSDKDDFYRHLREGGYLFHSEAHKIGDAEILALWQSGSRGHVIV